MEDTIEAISVQTFRDLLLPSNHQTMSLQFLDSPSPPISYTNLNSLSPSVFQQNTLQNQLYLYILSFLALHLIRTDTDDSVLNNHFQQVSLLLYTNIISGLSYLTTNYIVADLLTHLYPLQPSSAPPISAEQSLASSRQFVASLLQSNYSTVLAYTKNLSLSQISASSIDDILRNLFFQTSEEIVLHYNADTGRSYDIDLDNIRSLFFSDFDTFVELRQVYFANYEPIFDYVSRTNRLSIPLSSFSADTFPVESPWMTDSVVLLPPLCVSLSKHILSLPPDVNVLPHGSVIVLSLFLHECVLTSTDITPSRFLMSQLAAKSLLNFEEMFSPVMTGGVGEQISPWINMIANPEGIVVQGLRGIQQTITHIGQNIPGVGVVIDGVNDGAGNAAFVARAWGNVRDAAGRLVPIERVYETINAVLPGMPNAEQAIPEAIPQAQAVAAAAATTFTATGIATALGITAVIAGASYVAYYHGEEIASSISNFVQGTARPSEVAADFGLGAPEREPMRAPVLETGVPAREPMPGPVLGSVPVPQPPPQGLGAPDLTMTEEERAADRAAREAVKTPFRNFQEAIRRNVFQTAMTREDAMVQEFNRRAWEMGSQSLGSDTRFEQGRGLGTPNPEGFQFTLPNFTTRDVVEGTVGVLFAANIGLKFYRYFSGQSTATPESIATIQSNIELQGVSEGVPFQEEAIINVPEALLPTSETFVPFVDVPYTFSSEFVAPRTDWTNVQGLSGTTEQEIPPLEEEMPPLEEEVVVPTVSVEETKTSMPKIPTKKKAWSVMTDEEKLQDFFDSNNVKKPTEAHYRLAKSYVQLKDRQEKLPKPEEEPVAPRNPRGDSYAERIERLKSITPVQYGEYTGEPEEAPISFAEGQNYGGPTQARSRTQQNVFDTVRTGFAGFFGGASGTEPFDVAQSRFFLHTIQPLLVNQVLMNFVSSEVLDEYTGNYLAHFCLFPSKPFLLGLLAVSIVQQKNEHTEQLIQFLRNANAYETPQKGGVVSENIKIKVKEIRSPKKNQTRRRRR